MICDKCKKFFVAGNRPNGIPNGVKLLQKDGSSITLCADCVMKLGQLEGEQRDEFFKELKGKPS